MNSCDFYQELISRLVDGEVSHDEYEALMAHMKSCSRCNAMYAVFHDLSDLIADEAREELPEGLHENIMAGVRRSAIEKKNRRMRSIGLRTALTAAACAVLVLFASLGFAPHERAENVSIRSQQAAEEILPAAPAETAEQAAPAQPQPKIAASPAVTAAKETPAPETASVESAAASGNAESTVATGSAESAPDAAADVFLAPAAPAAPVPNTAQPAEAAAQPETPAEAAETESVTLDLSEQAPAPEAAEAAPAEEAAVEEEKRPFFGGLTDLFTSNAYSTESTVTSKDEADEETQAQETPEPSETPAPTATPALSANSAPSATPAPTTIPATEKTRSVSLRGREQRAKLLALLGEKEGALPEAELTSRIRVTFVPEDEYGTEEKLEIRFYDDFVYFLRKDADGIEKSYCAACSVSELESFLKNADSGASPSPTPTADPFAAAPEDGVNLIVH